MPAGVVGAVAPGGVGGRTGGVAGAEDAESMEGSGDWNWACSTAPSISRFRSVMARW